MKRAEWALGEDSLHEEDTSRPLTGVGRMQAHNIVPALAAFGIETLYSSDSRRCRDTVSPYASARSLPIAMVHPLSEEAHKADPQAAVDFTAGMALRDTHAALCTHRPVMPTVMAALQEAFLADEAGKKAFDATLTPGSLVVFHRDPANLALIWAVERHIR
jgi:8-oxo-dGTP diphosphatase